MLPVYKNRIKLFYTLLNVRQPIYRPGTAIVFTPLIFRERVSWMRVKLRMPDIYFKMNHQAFSEQVFRQDESLISG